MKELNQAYLTGNLNVDKYLIENPNLELHDTLDIRNPTNIRLSSWYEYLLRHLSIQQFQDYIHHRYQHGYKAYLDHLAKDMTPYDSLEAAITDSSLWGSIKTARKNLELIKKINNLTSTAYEITMALVSNHIWIDQIADYYLFENLYSRKRTFEIVKTIIQTTEDLYILVKLSHHQEKYIQVFSSQKTRIS